MKTYKIMILLLGVLLLYVLAACGKKGDRQAGPELARDKQPVTVEELTLRELDEYVRVSGKLEGITNVTMSSEASGRLVELYRKLGDRVGKGERIGRLENEAYQYRQDQAEALVVSAEAALDNAQRNLTFAESSLARNLISQAEYDGYLTAFKAAKANLDGAKANLEAARSGVSGSYLTAPQGGTISDLNVTAGQFVAAGARVATITDASRLVLKTGVGESQIASLRQGQPAEITYSGQDMVFKGRVTGFGISPLAGSATYPVEIGLDSPRNLLPGMVVSARILVNRYRGLLYTSLTHISNEYGRTYAFTVDDKNVAHKRQIRLGRVISGNVLIESGLQVGDRIVTSGAGNLEEGSLVEIRK